MLRALLGWGLVALLVLFVAVQLVPYGRAHPNPPVRAEPAWDSPQTRVLTVWACFDCHSNETVWPWYSNIAPASWLLQYDVDEGRREVNYSEWDQPQRESRESAETIQQGTMPPQLCVTPPSGPTRSRRTGGADSRAGGHVWLRRAPVGICLVLAGPWSVAETRRWNRYPPDRSAVSSWPAATASAPRRS